MPDPHSQAILNQSPRLTEPDRIPPHGATRPFRNAGLGPHSSAPRNGLSGAERRTGDARRGRRETHGARTALATAALVAAFWLIFLGLLAVAADARCRTHKCWHRVHEARAQHWLKTHRPWVWSWRHQVASDQNWLIRVARCESGNNPRANTGNGFYGLTQFTAQTAYAAGFHRLPHLTSWHEQAVRSIVWMHKAGMNQWPVCSYR